MKNLKIVLVIYMRLKRGNCKDKDCYFLCKDVSKAFG